MKFAIITDTHWGVRADSLIHLDYQQKFYDENFFPYLEEHKIDTLFHLGDLVDRRKYINFVTLKRMKEVFLDRLRDMGITMHIIAGNHDTSFRNTNDVNSIDLLLQEYPNVHMVYASPEEVVVDGFAVLLVPWITAANSEETREAVRVSKATLCMGHFEFSGFELLRGQLAEHGAKHDEYRYFDQVYSGHYHHPSSRDNVVYLGAPYEMTWSDAGGWRGFHVYDTATRELTEVRNRFTLFNRIDYDDTELTADEVNNLDLTPLNRTYVKVQVVSKKNPYLLDLLVGRINAVGPADVKVVEHHEVALTEDLVVEAADTPTTLRNYVDSLSTRVDKSRLKGLLQELYTEASAL